MAILHEEIRCDYCDLNKGVRPIQLWTGWHKELCPKCINTLNQKFRYMKHPNGEYICYSDKENDLWGVESEEVQN